MKKTTASNSSNSSIVNTVKLSLSSLWSKVKTLVNRGWTFLSGFWGMVPASLQVAYEACKAFFFLAWVYLVSAFSVIFSGWNDDRPLGIRPNAVMWWLCGLSSLFQFILMLAAGGGFFGSLIFGVAMLGIHLVSFLTGYTVTSVLLLPLQWDRVQEEVSTRLNGKLMEALDSLQAANA